MPARWICLSFLSLFLAACGGGSGNDNASAGSGSNPPPTTTPPPSSGNGNGSGNTPAPGPLTNIQFNSPGDIAADASGNIYVVDGEVGSNRILRIAQDGVVTTLAQSETPLTRISALAAMPNGDIYYIRSQSNETTYTYSDAIWKRSNGGAAQMVASITAGPLAVDASNGDIFAYEAGNVIRVSQDGSKETLFSVNGGTVESLAFHNGTLWSSVYYLSRAGRETRVLAWRRGESAGTPLSGMESDWLDVDMASTEAGIYLVHADANQDNPSRQSCVVDLLDTVSLTTSSVAGQPGEPCGYQDGIGAAARLNSGHITQGSDGNLYITDPSNNVIRRVTPAGAVSLFAGTPEQ